MPKQVYNYFLNPISFANWVNANIVWNILTYCAGNDQTLEPFNTKIKIVWILWKSIGMSKRNRLDLINCWNIYLILHIFFKIIFLVMEITEPGSWQDYLTITITNNKVYLILMVINVACTITLISFNIFYWISLH